MHAFVFARVEQADKYAYIQSAVIRYKLSCFEKLGIKSCYIPHITVPVMSCDVPVMSLILLSNIETIDRTQKSDCKFGACVHHDARGKKGAFVEKE